MHLLSDLARRIDRVNDAIGTTVLWLATFLVLLQFAALLLRHVFSYNLILIQDSLLYLHSFVFLIGAGFTLLQDGHVRVDIFQSRATPRTRAWIDLIGVLLFLLPFCVVLLWHAIPFAARSWTILESAQEVTGLHAVFALKSALVLFALLLALQGFSTLIKCLSRLSSGLRMDS